MREWQEVGAVSTTSGTWISLVYLRLRYELPTWNNLVLLCCFGFVPVLTELIMAFLCLLWKFFTILSPTVNCNFFKIKILNYASNTLSLSLSLSHTHTHTHTQWYCLICPISERQIKFKIWICFLWSLHNNVMDDDPNIRSTFLSFQSGYDVL